MLRRSPGFTATAAIRIPAGTRVWPVLEGIARTHRNAPKKKVALLRDPITQIVERIDVTTTEGLRDRALILLGFALGLRRSELVAIGVEDLSPQP